MKGAHQHSSAGDAVTAPVRTAVLRDTDTTSAGEAVERGPRALLVGMETGTGTMGHSVETPQEMKTRATTGPRQPTSGLLWKKRKH